MLIEFFLPPRLCDLGAFHGATSSVTLVGAPGNSGCLFFSIIRAANAVLFDLDEYTVSMYDRMVIRSFADAATNDVFHGEDSGAARRLPKEVWSVIRRKLDALHATSILNDLRVPPGNRLETLRGDQAGRHSIRVNDKLRITFRFEGGHAWEVRCEDYH